jgi:hypothetical protein
MKQCPTFGRKDSEGHFMLANNVDISARFGALSSDVHKPATFRYELLDFIAEELPHWRDRTDRPNETSETILTSQLCAHLNSVSRHSAGWDVLQFRVEEADEKHRGRKIDLVASPCGVAIWVNGRRHTDFDNIMPVECKRLPTPKADGRDEREYVISQKASTGGIQRFKAGHHGAAHRFGAMIGYVQEETTTVWDKRVAVWIGDLAGTQAGWTTKDLLHIEREDAALRLAVFRSSHERQNGLSDIELRHLWIEMN